MMHARVLACLVLRTTEKSDKHRYTMQLAWAEKVKSRPKNQIVWFENLFYLASI